MVPGCLPSRFKCQLSGRNTCGSIFSNDELKQTLMVQHTPNQSTSVIISANYKKISAGIMNYIVNNRWAEKFVS